MTDHDRFKLLGTYRTPRVRVGAVLACESRDCDVIVTGYTDGPIPWPVGQARGKGSRHSPVLYGALVRAVRRESVLAVCHWFGAAKTTVWRWRKALGVGFSTEGTFRLKSRHSKEPWAVAAREMAWAKAGDPERRRKIADSKRGKPRPRHAIEAMRKGRQAKPLSPEARAKISAALRERAKLFVRKCPVDRWPDGVPVPPA